MMMRCLVIAGKELAYDKVNKQPSDIYRNPYGCFEGKWNGKDGVIKLFSIPNHPNMNNPKVIYMYRDPKKIVKSWDDVKLKMKAKNPDFNKREELMAKRFEFIDKWIQNYQHIKIDYDTFVTNPETYRDAFTALFPEINYDTLISGIDRELYLPRNED